MGGRPHEDARGQAALYRNEISDPAQVPASVPAHVHPLVCAHSHALCLAGHSADT